MLAFSVFACTALASELEVLARLLREVREEENILRMAQAPQYRLERTPHAGGSAEPTLNFADKHGNRFERLYWEERKCAVPNGNAMLQLESGIFADDEDTSQCAWANGISMNLAEKRMHNGASVWTAAESLKGKNKDGTKKNFGAVAEAFNVAVAGVGSVPTTYGVPAIAKSGEAKEMNMFAEGKLFIKKGNKQIEIGDLAIGQGSWKPLGGLIGLTRKQFWWMGADRGCEVVKNYARDIIKTRTDNAAPGKYTGPGYNKGSPHALRCTVFGGEDDEDGPVFIYASGRSKQEFIIDIPESTWAENSITIPAGKNIPYYKDDIFTDEEFSLKM